VENLLFRLFELLAESGAVATGVTDAGPYPVGARYEEWFSRGMGDRGGYLGRHLPLKESAGNVLPSARSVISAAFPYRLADWGTAGTPAVAGFAWGVDYHRRIGALLTQVARQVFPPESYRVVVDSAPLPERYIAQRAGVGFPGRSGNLIVPGVGPAVVLGEIVTTLALPVSPSPEVDGCGSCRACVDACPVEALSGDGFLDTRRCLSAFTTEPAQPPPDDVARALDGRLFGCEECVRVCPHHHPAPPEFSDPLPPDRYYALAGLSFRATFGETTIARLGRSRLLAGYAYSLIARADPRVEKILAELSCSVDPRIEAAAARAVRLRKEYS